MVRPYTSRRVSTRRGRSETGTLRKFLATALGFFVLFPAAALGDSPPKALHIWHQFYFEKGLDYNRFGELASSRDQFRRVFVEEIAALLERGALPGEALEVLLKLDHHYLENLDRAAKGLEATFAAEFRAALVEQYERANKPQRLIVTDGAYLASLSQGALARAETPRIDMVASGTWSNIDGYTVRVSVDFVMAATGRLVSFSAQGSIPSAAASIAFQLFDYFEKNRFPQPENPLAQLEIRPSLPGHQNWMGVPYDVARRTCESQGFRLPYSYEMDLIYAAGPYQAGGIHIDPNWYYHVADSEDLVWIAPGKLEFVRGTSQPNFEKRKYYYVMVKGPLSPRIQILTALDAFLQRESRKTDTSRDRLAMYAVRIILSDLSAKRCDGIDTRRVMAQEFSRRGIRPLDYLRQNDVLTTIGLAPTLQAELSRMLVDG
jgi:hypothetical protein